MPADSGPKSLRLTPQPDGGLAENDFQWAPGAKTIVERTLELLNEGYVLVSTHVDGSRLFERRPDL